MRNLFIILCVASLFSSCRSAKNLSQAISNKDSAMAVVLPVENDSVKMVKQTLSRIEANHIDFRTFSAKVKVGYADSRDQKYDFNAFIRIRKDSAIWISIIAALGIEAIRAIITPDSVKILDKLKNTVTFKKLSYIQEIANLPIDFRTIQDLIIGNPVYMDSNIVSYKQEPEVISMSMLGSFFKNYVTVSGRDYNLRNSKLDDVDLTRSRTANLSYDNYAMAGKWNFSGVRQISITEKNKLDIDMEFKQVQFDTEVDFPFNIPKNYKLK